MKMTYIKTPINKYTFKSEKIKKWVESNCLNFTLNAFAGCVKLNVTEYRIDQDVHAIADEYCDIIDFVNDKRIDLKNTFDTVLLDPPYSLRKSMECYNGNKMSQFNYLKNIIAEKLCPERVITFGYQSVSMGIKRGYKQTELCIMHHGGAIHDTIAVVEDRE